MKRQMKKLKLGFLLFAGVFILTHCCFPSKISAAEKTYAAKGDVVDAVNKLLGAKTKAPSVTAYDVKENSKYYNAMSIAIRAGIISPNKNNELQPKKRATASYIANLLSRATGLPVKEILESKDLKKNMTKKEVTAFIKKIVPNIVSSDTQKVKKGTVVINTPDVKLSNLNITGNLVIGDGVSDGTVTLENVVVNGKTYIRGGGEHSIYANGNSKLFEVKIKQVYNQVRLHAADSAVVTSLTIKEGCNDVICEGNYKIVTVKNAEYQLKFNNASIDNLVVAQKKVSIQTEGKTNINTALIKTNASNSEMNLAQGTTINKVAIYGTNTKLEGQGTVKSIYNAANNSSISAPYFQIETKEGVTGTVINSNPSAKKESDSSNSNSNSSPSGSTPSYSDVQITGVYAKPGSIEVTLNKAVSLTQNSFYISCLAGNDMTILKSETVEGADKNKMYYLSTTFYADNTYLLTITLPDGSKIEKEFIASSLIPVLSNISAERKSTTDAEFSFTANDSGILYFMLVPVDSAGKSNLGMELFRLIGSNIPQNGEEIKNNGEMFHINAGLNTISLTTLTKGTAYTIYYAEAIGNSDTPIIQPPIQMNAEPLITNPSDITIEKCIGIDNQTISVKLSKPTGIPLELSAFSVSCPAGAITLGSLETSDNQTYTLHLPAYDHLMSYNTYTVIIHFSDKTDAKGSFYGDFEWPKLEAFTVKHTAESEVIVTFKSNEGGKLHYVISETELTKPEEILQNAAVKAVNLFAGANEIKITDFTEGQKQYFCMIAEDSAGNMPVFVERKLIPSEITPDTASGLNEIVDLKTGSTIGIDGKNATTITFSLKEEEDLTSLDTKYGITFVTLEGGSQNEPRVFTIRNVDDYTTLKGKNFILSLNTELPAGRYRLEMNLPTSGKTVKEFRIS